ncbi:hypothetical protein Y032_0371g128 [Ancylostoma ceylanicum]|uniref:Uncharacterized protein n=1 Tax=Ancylostoma ceylanicum TaxID=53326 RepID=A0A016RUY0_9BILA|nr:hypothetical protein Y032_0371g128 [Ancylostoma ceylanicum]
MSQRISSAECYLQGCPLQRKDIRACKYELDESNNYRWIPCSKQAKRRHVQENSQFNFCDGTSKNVAEFIYVEEV